MVRQSISCVTRSLRNLRLLGCQGDAPGTTSAAEETEIGPKRDLQGPLNPDYGRLVTPMKSSPVLLTLELLHTFGVRI